MAVQGNVVLHKNIYILCISNRKELSKQLHMNTTNLETQQKMQKLQKTLQTKELQNTKVRKLKLTQFVIKFLINAYPPLISILFK